jgi:TolB protein
MRTTIAKLAPALLLLAGASSSGPAGAAAGDFHLESTIAFTSNRDNLSLVVPQPTLRFEVYLMNPDGTNARRLTHNTDADGLAALSPDGKQIVFDSNRNRADYLSSCGADSLFVSDLFVMDTTGGEQTLLRRASSSGSWSPDSKNIAYHASASGVGCPSRSDPGAAASDSDIFVVNLDDLLADTEQPTNITNTPDKIDDDADWSPTAQRLVYTAHDVGDDIPSGPGFLSNSAELYVTNADGSDRLRLTQNTFEERAPAWSPSGDKIVYSCRIGGGAADFEICVINSDGTGAVQLTNNSVADLTATWSPDGQQIGFQRPVPGQGNQLFTMPPSLNQDGTLPSATQRTFPPGISLLANWGNLRVKGEESAP